METDPSRTHCIRCGECCLKSGPTLQADDLYQIEARLLHKQDLYTIRVGELVFDNINNQLKFSETELIKIKERDAGKGCIHYDDDDKACTIYEHRPSQCSALFCWDEQEFMRVQEGPKLERKAIIQDTILLGLMEQHEKRCSYSELEKLVRQIEAQGAKAVEELIERLRFDHELRPFVSEKMGIDSNEMDLIFGRPLTETVTMFGLKVVREPDGSFYLTVEKNP